jgi:hypothetical protein
MWRSLPWRQFPMMARLLMEDLLRAGHKCLMYHLDIKFWDQNAEMDISALALKWKKHKGSHV